MKEEISQRPLTNSWEDKIYTLSVFTGYILIALSNKSHLERDITIRNFIARGMVCTQSIFQLWNNNDEQGAWILHRTLMDRLFHIHYIIEHDSFSDFQDFSFIKTYEIRDRILSDPDTANKLPESLKTLHQESLKRYNELKSKPNKWSRPKAKTVAANMNMKFLYNLGYDYASMHVHPMADDGIKDCTLLITPTHKKQPLEDTTVLRNSIIVQTMLIQEGINGTTVKWRAIIYNFLDQILLSLEDENIEYMQTFYKIGKAYPDYNVCEKRN